MIGSLILHNTYHIKKFYDIYIKYTRYEKLIKDQGMLKLNFCNATNETDLILIISITIV